MRYNWSIIWKTLTNALSIFGKPCKRAGLGPSGVSIVLISRVKKETYGFMKIIIIIKA